MRDFLVTSLVLSVGLTVVLNLLPRLFPNATRKAEAKLHERLERSTEAGSPQDQPAESTSHGPEATARQSWGGVRFFFPWKAMLIGSILLTVLLNLGFFFG